MNLFMTQGTTAYLESVKNNYPDEKIVLYQNDVTGLIIHETKGTTVFNEPRKYEIIDSIGVLDSSDFIVLNHTPVTEEGRPVFEYQFKKKSQLFETAPGFIALRALRPMNSDTYIILSVWKDEKDFNLWKRSPYYQTIHSKDKPKSTDSLLHQISVYPRPSYETKYYSLNHEEE